MCYMKSHTYYKQEEGNTELLRLRNAAQPKTSIKEQTEHLIDKSYLPISVSRQSVLSLTKLLLETTKH